MSVIGRILLMSLRSEVPNLFGVWVEAIEQPRREHATAGQGWDLKYHTGLRIGEEECFACL